MAGTSGGGEAAARRGGRAGNEVREIEAIPGFVDGPVGSVLYRAGRTRVLCVATLEAGTPAWMSDDSGWLTAEYSLLPYSTEPRAQRRSEGRLDGRTQEIQRLIGRSLRAGLDRRRMPNLTFRIDCDVVQADGGTRTASICGASIALGHAVRQALEDGRLAEDPRIADVVAVSVGVSGGVSLLDLDYFEDSRADLDLNLVGTGDGRLIEIQGAAEGAPLPSDRWRSLIDLGMHGLATLRELLAPYLTPLER